MAFETPSPLECVELKSLARSFLQSIFSEILSGKILEVYSARLKILDLRVQSGYQVIIEFVIESPFLNHYPYIPVNSEVMIRLQQDYSVTENFQKIQVLVPMTVFKQREKEDATPDPSLAEIEEATLMALTDLDGFGKIG